MHNANLLDTQTAISMTVASCEIVMPAGSSVDLAHPGYLTSTVLNHWTY